MKWTDQKLLQLFRHYGASRPEGEFRDPETFAREFFRRTAERPEIAPSWLRLERWSRVAANIFCAAAVVAVIAVPVMMGVAHSRSRVPAPAADEGLAEAQSRMEATLSLFGNDAGVGYVGGELFTFDRQSGRPAERLLQLRLADDAGNELLAIEVAAAENDYLAIDTPRVRGTIFLHRTDDALQVLDLELEVNLADGRPVQVRKWQPLDRNHPVSAINGYRLEQRWLSLG